MIINVRRREAERSRLAISGLCSFLFWPYPLTSNDPKERARGMELAGKMTEAAHHLGTENLLVVPGAVHMPWREDHEPTRNDECDRRARAAPKLGGRAPAPAGGGGGGVPPRGRPPRAPPPRGRSMWSCARRW